MSDVENNRTVVFGVGVGSVVCITKVFLLLYQGSFGLTNELSMAKIYGWKLNSYLINDSPERVTRNKKLEQTLF